MWKDEIIEELHAIRAAHAAQMGYDSKRIFDELKAHEEISKAQGFKFVSYPPRRPEGWVAAGQSAS